MLPGNHPRRPRVQAYMPPLPLLLILACAPDRTAPGAPPSTLTALPVASAEPAEAGPPPCSPDGPDGLEALLDPYLADGFDFPVGDVDGRGRYTSTIDGSVHEGWYVAAGVGESYSLGIHPGEDWNGNGGGHSDRGQPVYALGSGCVIAARDEGALWGNVVVLSHRYLDNGTVKRVDSLYAHLDSVAVEAGQRVDRRALLGTIGDGHGAFLSHLHLELRRESLADRAPTFWPSSHDKDRAWVLAHYEVPRAFIAAHRSLPVPATMPNLLVAEKHAYRIHRYREGVRQESYPIALSQDPSGHKQRRGDNRLPEGAYRIVEKSRGPFTGAVAAFFGPAWMRLSYPNDWDAASGLDRGLIDQAQHDAILAANARGVMPPKTTRLGGGIGIHGWAGEWPEHNRHLTWGCISMRNPDVDALYDLVEVGTPIWVLP